MLNFLNSIVYWFIHPKTTKMSEIEESNNIRDKEGFFNCKVCANRFYSNLGFKVHLKTEHVSIKLLQKAQHSLFQEDIVFPTKEEKQCQITKSLHHEEFVKPNETIIESEENIFPKNVFENSQVTILPKESRSQKHDEMAADEIIDEIDELLSNLQRFEQSAFQARVQKNIQGVHDQFKQLQCKKCQKTFTKKQRLQSHFQSVHEKLNSFPCLECNRPFGRRDNLQCHEKIFHGTKKRFQCLVCKKSFGQEENLKTHKEIHHEKLNPHQCHVCKMTFYRKNRLKIHFQSVHENLKSFQCLECNRPFNRIDHLQKHGKIFHGLKKRFQ